MGSATNEKQRRDSRKKPTRPFLEGTKNVPRTRQVQYERTNDLLPSTLCTAFLVSAQSEDKARIKGLPPPPIYLFTTSPTFQSFLVYHLPCQPAQYFPSIVVEDGEEREKRGPVLDTGHRRSSSSRFHISFAKSTDILMGKRALLPLFRHCQKRNGN